MKTKKVNKLTKFCLVCRFPFDYWPSQDVDGRKKFCSKSCRQLGRAGHPVSNFLNKISVKTSGCWEWEGTRNEHGYGELELNKQRHIRSHRFMWELVNGEITNGLFVLHKCDNPPCCNPDHLFLGTQRDNMVDMNKKNRHRYKKA